VGKVSTIAEKPSSSVTAFSRSRRPLAISRSRGNQFLRAIRPWDIRTDASKDNESAVLVTDNRALSRRQPRENDQSKAAARRRKHHVAFVCKSCTITTGLSDSMLEALTLRRFSRGKDGRNEYGTCRRLDLADETHTTFHASTNYEWMW
jgi:hypothetical protein